MIAPLVLMDNARLEERMRQEARVLDGQAGFWRIEFDGQEVFVITDEAYDRVRIMTPVIEEHELDEHELRTLLSANFDRALDARYALGDGYLWSVFVHPLHDLTDDMLADALRQVCRLADTFGTTYSSSDLIFGGSA